MDVRVEQNENLWQFHLEGRLDLAGAEAVENAFNPLKSQKLFGCTLIIDFSGVHYISSSGLRVIVACFNHLEEQEGRMILCGMDIAVREVFDFAGLSDVFTISESINEALDLARSY